MTSGDGDCIPFLKNISEEKRAIKMTAKPDMLSSTTLWKYSNRKPYTSIAKGMQKFPTELTTANTLPDISVSVFC
jgi:hypothetical protein